MFVFEMNHSHWVVIARNTNAFVRRLSGMKRGECVDVLEGVDTAILLMIVHSRDGRQYHG